MQCATRKVPICALLISLGMHLLLVLAIHQSPPAGGTADRLDVWLVRAASREEQADTQAAPSPPESEVNEARSVLPSPNRTHTAVAAAARKEPPEPSSAAGAIAASSSTEPSLQPSNEYYYSISEVDILPKALRSLPVNPQELRAYSDGGTLEVELFIDEFGKVKKVRNWPTTLPDTFRQFVVEGFLKSAFKPAQKDGIAVKARMRVVVEFAALGPDGLPQVKMNYVPGDAPPNTPSRPEAHPHSG